MTKKYDPTIGLWATKSGSGHSAVISPELIKTLKEFTAFAEANIGGRIGVFPNKFATPDNRQPSVRLSALPAQEQKDEAL